MGNSLDKKFDLPKENTATAGHCQLWKIWPGTSKLTRKEVSVWMFDKGDLPKRRFGAITDKAMIEQIHQIMRKDMMALKDLQSSNIVQIQEVLEDGKSVLAFVTERIVCSLADIMTRFAAINGGVQAVASYLEGYVEPNGTLSEIELGRGILNICEGLQYLHTISKKLHLNISPEAIVITATGQWKLCGMGLCCATLTTEATPTVASPYFLKPSAPLSLRLEPDLAFSCPELTEGGSQPAGVRNVTAIADVFSLGVLAYEIYRFNFKLIPEGKQFMPIISVMNNSADRHTEALQVVRNLDCSFLPSAMQPLVINMTQIETRFRMTTTDVSNNQFFSTGTLAILKILDSLQGRDTGAQAAQLVSLAPQFHAFTPRILENTVLPSVCKLCDANPAIWPYVFPILEVVKTRSTIERVREKTSLCFETGLALLAPTDTVQAFLKSYEFILDTFDGPFISANFISGLICNALDTKNTVVQSLALSVLCEDRVRLAIDQTTLVEKVVPKACREACKNSDAKIKMQALFFISLVSQRLDSAYIAKNIIPSLKYILDHDKDAMVSMCVIGNYGSLAESVEPQLIATAILPTIQPMLIDKSLNSAQFQQILLGKLLELRSVELMITPSLTLDAIHDNNVDPFAGARALLVPVKPAYAPVPPSQTSSFGSVPPPLPAMPPPPIPSTAPPPLPTMAPPPLPTSAPPPIPTAPPPLPPLPPSFGVDTAAGASALGFGGLAPSIPPPIPPSPVDAEPALNPFAAPVANVPAPSPAPTPSTSSTFSWLTGGSKSSSSSTAQTVSTPAYIPPAAAANVTTSNPSSGLNDMIDEDDFLASFGKAPGPAPASGIVNETNFAAVGINAKKAGISKKSTGSKSGTGKTGSVSSPIGTGPQTATNLFSDDLVGIGSGPQAAPVVSAVTQNSTMNGPTTVLSMEQQIAQTQAQIAKMSSQLQQFQSPSIGSNSSVSSAQSVGVMSVASNHPQSSSAPLAPNFNFINSGASSQTNSVSQLPAPVSQQSQGMMGQPSAVTGQPQPQATQGMMGQQQPQGMMGQSQPQGMMGQQQPQGMMGQPHLQGMMGQPHLQGMMGQPHLQGMMGQPQPQGMMGQPQPQGMMGQPQPQGMMGQPQPQGMMGQPLPQGMMGQPQPLGMMGQPQPQGMMGQPQGLQRPGGYGQQPALGGYPPQQQQAFGGMPMGGYPQQQMAANFSSAAAGSTQVPGYSFGQQGSYAHQQQMQGAYRPPQMALPMQQNQPPRGPAAPSTSAQNRGSAFDFLN